MTTGRNSDRDKFRSLGRRGGLSLAAKTDMRAVAARARKHSPQSLDYWRAKVDPAGELEVSDRDTRARAAQRLHFSELARRSAQARRAKSVDATDGGPITKPAAVNNDPGGPISRVHQSR